MITVDPPSPECKDTYRTLMSVLPASYPIPLRIRIHPNFLSLHCADGTLAPLEYGFLTRSNTHLARSLTQKQPLWRAFGKHNAPIRIHDLTAGFGRDSFICAHLGAEVISIERNPLLYALLFTQVQRLKIHQPSIKWTVLHANSITWLTERCERVEYTYFDPFFHKKTSSLPQKNLQWLQYLANDTEDNAETLFKACQKVCQKRIVVKRPLHASQLGNCIPNGSILQKSTRFDYYQQPQN